MFRRNSLRLVGTKPIVRVGTLNRVNAWNATRFQSSDIEKRRNDLLAALSSNAGLAAAFEEFGKLIESKGFNGDMGVMQQMKFLMDSDVRKGLKKVGEELKQSGVKLTAEDLEVVTSIMKMKK